MYQDLPKAVTLLFFLLTFGSFTWAIPAFFRQVEQQPIGLALIKYVGAAMLCLSGAVHVFVAQAPIILWGAGIGLFVLSLILFWHTIHVHRKRPPHLAFSPVGSDHIVMCGPYRHIRHPFYAAYALGWIANFMVSGSALLLIPIICMGVLYVSAAQLEEAQFMNGPLRHDYESYRKRTRMFVPFIW